MTKKKRTIILAVVLVFLAGVGITACWQYQAILRERLEAEQIPDLSEQSPPPVDQSEPEPPQEEPEPLPEEAASLAEIDLDALREVNEDVIGWITIPDTELSYPLVQGTDNQYYLTHNWKKEYSSGGSVFLESTNSGTLTDYHTIVYAHRMYDTSMFGTLKFYKDLDYWREHPRIYVLSDTGVGRYDIFSAQEISIKGMVYRLDIEEKHLEEDFLQYCIEGSQIDTGLVPTPDMPVLTLSTCTGNGHATRWVVHGALVQTYGLPETVSVSQNET